MKITEPFFNPICFPVPKKEERSLPLNSKVKKFEYFDPLRNGEVLWLELIIYVLPKQEIKYQPNNSIIR